MTAPILSFIRYLGTFRYLYSFCSIHSTSYIPALYSTFCISSWPKHFCWFHLHFCYLPFPFRYILWEANSLQALWWLVEPGRRLGTRFLGHLWSGVPLQASACCSAVGVGNYLSTFMEHWSSLMLQMKGGGLIVWYRFCLWDDLIHLMELCSILTLLISTCSVWVPLDGVSDHARSLLHSCSSFSPGRAAHLILITWHDPFRLLTLYIHSIVLSYRPDSLSLMTFLSFWLTFCVSLWWLFPSGRTTRPLHSLVSGGGSDTLTVVGPLMTWLNIWVQLP